MPKKTHVDKRILNCLPSPEQENDWLLDEALTAGVLDAEAAIPASKDLRESWWTIGDQQATGSCVGWATADSVLRWHFVTAGRLPKSEELSVRFIWMAAKETDEFIKRPSAFIETEGTSLKAALDVARNFGVLKDEYLPFGSGSLFKEDAKVCYARAAELRIASYFNLDRNLAEWRKWLATSGPILTRLDVDATWMNAKDTNGNLDAYQPDTVRGGHAVSIVGYTPTSFIVRNSWGTTWGDDGFAYASIPYAQAAFTEAYGISV